MAKKKKPKAAKPSAGAAELRIIGGRLRGSKLPYSGDRRTRPMKERVREAMFNLIGHAAEGRHVIDLFAGTGAIGFEAMSRGATRATFIERHFPTARQLRDTARQLGLSEVVEIAAANTFLWYRQNQLATDLPWLVCCSPPYDLYIDEAEKMLGLLDHFLSEAPAASLLVVETDRRFDLQTLPRADCWDARQYPPAVIAILEVDAIHQSASGA